jgi:single-stranded DNA-binding protein
VSSAAFTVQGFIASELTVRDAGSHRVVDVVVPYTRRRRDPDGTWRDLGTALWVAASFWDEHADVVLQSCGKGTLVVLAGDPELELYTRRDGQPGGKLRLHQPTLSVVVRRPAAGTAPAPAVGSGAWPDPAEPDPTDASWVAAPAGSYSDDTPF